MCRIDVCVVACAALLAGGATPVMAQAWGAPAGTGSISFAYQTIENTGHLLTDGSLLPDGKSRTAGLYAEVEYAVTDRLSLSAGLPFVFAKYLGPGPAVGNRLVDQCFCWQHGWQDVGATARFNVSNGTFGLAPSISIGVPSHDYTYQGEAVVGRDLREVRVSVDAGRRLDAISPRLSLSGRYSYAIVERVLDVPNNRSNAQVEGAYALSRRFSASGIVMWQRTHGGLRAGTGPPPPIAPLPWGEIATAQLFDQHDRLLRDNNIRLGATVSYSWTRVDVFGSYVAYVDGTDSHAGRAVTVGVSWPFELSR